MKFAYCDRRPSMVNINIYSFDRKQAECSFSHSVENIQREPMKNATQKKQNTIANKNGYGNECNDPVKKFAHSAFDQFVYYILSVTTYSATYFPHFVSLFSFDANQNPLHNFNESRSRNEYEMIIPLRSVTIRAYHAAAFESISIDACAVPSMVKMCRRHTKIDRKRFTIY